MAADTVAYPFIHPPCPMDFNIPPLPDAKLPKSALIKPGDKVWDASGPFRDRGITFDHGWVCWNDTAKLMICRGDPIDLHVFAVTYPVYDQRLMIRTTWEWWTAPDDAWHVAFNSSKPVHRLMVMSGTGGTAKAEQAVLTPDGLTATVEAETYLIDQFGFELTATVTWQPSGEGNRPQWTLNTKIPSREGQRRIVAGANIPKAGQNWILTVCHDLMLPDGRMLAESSKRQTARGIETTDMHLKNPIERRTLSGGRSLLIVGFPGGFSKSIGLESQPGEYEDPFDPFAPNPPDPKPAAIAKTGQLPAAVIPAYLKGECDERLLDAREALKKKGLPFAEDDFAGLDPARNVVWICTKSGSEAEIWCEQILCSVGRCGPAEIFTDLRMFRTQSGQDQPLLALFLNAPPTRKTTLKYNDPKHQTELTLELEADINEADDFDTSLTLEGAVPDANKPAIRFKRTERIGTVNTVPLTLPFYESQNGDSLRLRIKQDLVRDQDSMAPPPGREEKLPPVR
jgi:hypothetical protein